MAITNPLFGSNSENSLLFRRKEVNYWNSLTTKSYLNTKYLQFFSNSNKLQQAISSFCFRPEPKRGKKYIQ